MKQFIYKISLITGFLLIGLSSAQAATVQYGNQRVALASSFQSPMQCVLNSLKSRSYTPRRGGVGCFGYRPHNRSAHPGGYACDVEQSGRNITTLNRHFSYSQQISMAVGCKAVSGCKWRGRKGPDCGHFEQRSAPYFRSGTPPGGRKYYYKKAKYKKRRKKS